MGKSILLIEDEPNIIEAISFILSRAGWTVHSHSNGSDAAAEALRRKPDVVILDVMLPGKTGFEVLQDLREAEATKMLPVMMLTARGQTKDREMALASGANAFMTKPFSNSDVLAHVEALANT